MGKVTGNWELVGVCKKVKYTRKKKKKRGACWGWGGGVVSRKTKSMSNDVEDRTLKSSKPSRHARWRG